MSIIIKLDYTLESPEERQQLIEKILAETDPDAITPSYLEILANYLILCMEKQEKKERKILTDNRMMTVNKRETSFEGLSNQLENGEDGIYNLIANDKNIIFQPKISITKKDIETIPFLRQLRQEISTWDIMLKFSSGKEAYIIKKALIEMRKDQYIIKQAHQRLVIPTKITNSGQVSLILDDTSYIDDDLQLHVSGISIMDPNICSGILCNYSKLKEDSYDKFNSDTYYLIKDFEEVCDKALENYPLYKKIVIYKIDGKQNAEIQGLLEEEFGIKHSLEYISSLWRNKIPKLIAQTAQDNYITWYYKQHNIPLKKCSRCGQMKPAHNNFFSKNKTSKDSFYSICKACRNKKKES